MRQITEEREGGTRPSPKRPMRPDRRGPPPPPSMENARLYLQGGGRFVLKREAMDGRPFVTGSNGKTGWSVFPDGPVRVSEDPKRFVRGLPGEQHSIPLINIQEGLKGLVSAYDIELDEGNSSGNVNTTRMLMAQRKSPQHLGPRRVEITYVVESGLIERIRFVDMPRDRGFNITLQLTLIDHKALAPEIFLSIHLTMNRIVQLCMRITLKASDQKR